MHGKSAILLNSEMPIQRTLFVTSNLKPRSVRRELIVILIYLQSAGLCVCYLCLFYFLICCSADKDDDGFDLIQPSLIQQLKSILDQYPDDGQILKVKHITFAQKSPRLGGSKISFLLSATLRFADITMQSFKQYSTQQIGPRGFPLTSKIVWRQTE